MTTDDKGHDLAQAILRANCELKGHDPNESGPNEGRCRRCGAWPHASPALAVPFEQPDDEAPLFV